MVFSWLDFLTFMPIKQTTSRRRNLALFIWQQVCDSVVALARQATGSRALLARLFGAINIVRGIDERDVGKSLRKIAQQTLGLGIIFLGQQADIVAQPQQPLK